jgi:hypothetical protein
MRTIQLKGNNTALLYDSIYELPESRYHDFTKYSLFDLGVGGDMEAVNKHHSALDSYLKHGRNEDAIQERRNMHISYFYMIEKVNHKSLSFACMVHSVNGKEPDMSFDGLQSCIKELSRIGLKHGQVSDILEDVKKNLRQSLGQPFPEGTETMRN